MTQDDWDALAEKQLASITRDMKATTEDAMVRAAHKVMAELESQKPVARLIYKSKGSAGLPERFQEYKEKNT